MDDPRIDRNDRSGSRSTRLGLVALGFVVGVIVTLVIVFAIEIR